jgi:hypothetical protein
MKKIGDLFYIENAKSKGYENYEKGDVPFITNGDYEYAILGYVVPQKNDKVFNKQGICLSSFCEASIPKIPFLPRGNGGSGLVVLIPKKDMSEEELYFYASQLNMFKWRFSFSRMLISRRIFNLELVKYQQLSFKIRERMKELLPKNKMKKTIGENKNTQIFKVYDLCNVEKKNALPQNAITLGGTTPYVTTSSFGNGVSDFVDEVPNTKGKCLTVALNGSVGETFFQFDDFITSGDNAVLTLKEEYNPYLLFYIGVLIKNHQWKYNYYRKLTVPKLKNLTIPIPMKNKKIDLDYIERIVKNSYAFDMIKKYI